MEMMKNLPDDEHSTDDDDDHDDPYDRDDLYNHDEDDRANGDHPDDLASKPEDDAPISYDGTPSHLQQHAPEPENTLVEMIALDKTTMLPPDKILVTVVEKKTTRYYTEGIVIRQTDLTETYPAIVPADWNKHVVCNYGMAK